MSEKLKTTILTLLAAAAVSPLSTSCQRARTTPPPVVRSWAAMGAFASVSLPDADRDRLEMAARTAKQIVGDIESELSDFIPESAVSRINREAGSGEFHPLPEHSAAVFELSDKFWRLSSGAFDPSIRPFLHLWGFRGGVPVEPPAPERLAETAKLVGWRLLERERDMARLPLAGMELDFGGIAKGYAVDAVFERLKREGFADLMVNLSGNLRVAGASRPGRDGWVIAVRDPFLPYGEGRIGRLNLGEGMATATSGRYERYVEIDGRRYAHVLDPRTGRPVSGLAQVTVIAETAGDADGLSTALFVLGPGAGAEMLAKIPGVEALFVPDPPPGEEARALATPGFLKYFAPDSAWEARTATLQ